MLDFALKVGVNSNSSFLFKIYELVHCLAIFEAEVEILFGGEFYHLRSNWLLHRGPNC